MRENLLQIRWRLLMGVLALVAAVAVTLPKAASEVNLAQRVSEIWPNAVVNEVDQYWVGEIWPNLELGSVLPNGAAVIDGVVNRLSGN
jgi:hypothetical protein